MSAVLTEAEFEVEIRKRLEAIREAFHGVVMFTANTIGYREREACAALADKAGAVAVARLIRARGEPGELES